MKFKSISIMIIIVLLSTIIVPTVNATLSNDELLKMNGQTITNTTTISEINRMFGTPKIETVSAFGGKAYSYYDDDYTYYLYIETNASGNIMSYGAIGGNFEGQRYAQGDISDGTYTTLSGTVLEDFDDGTVYGIEEYNCDYWTDVIAYWENYQNDSSTYLYALQKHAIAANKVLAVMNGETFLQTYASEEIFYINEQLKYNGSNLYEYAQNTGKTQQITFSSITTGIRIL